MRPYLIVAAAAALLAACGDGAGGGSAQRDTVWAAGSSTVFPFTTRVAEYVSENSMGRGGYLQDRGLIPLNAESFAAQREAVSAQTIMSRPEE